MGTTNEITCKKCGAQATGDITYCPHCGELLPGKGKKRLVDESLIHDKWIHGDENFCKEKKSWLRHGYQLFSERIVCKLCSKLEHILFILLVICLIILTSVITVLLLLSTGSSILPTVLYSFFFSVLILYVPMLCINDYIYEGVGTDRMYDTQDLWRKNLGLWAYIKETSTPLLWVFAAAVIAEVTIFFFFVYKYFL